MLKLVHKTIVVKISVLQGGAMGTVVALLQDSCAGKLKKLDAV